MFWLLVTALSQAVVSSLFNRYIGEHLLLSCHNIFTYNLEHDSLHSARFFVYVAYYNRCNILFLLSLTSVNFNADVH